MPSFHDQPLPEGLPIGPDEIRRAASYVLDHPGAEAVEVLVTGSTVGLTRYARSAIIQNTVRHEVRANVRLHLGERVASASTNQLDAESMRATADKALEAARRAPVDPDFPGFAVPDHDAPPILRWDESTSCTSPAERAAAVATIVGGVGDGHAAGIFETGGHAFGLVSSHGLDRFDAFTRASTTCLADVDGATGWGEASAERMSTVDPAAVAARAATKARSGRGAVDGEPGRHEVVLEASAVAVLLDYLAYAGFGAKQVIDGDSFLSTRSGEQVAATDVDVSDDVRHPLSIGIAFDFEGSPRSRVPVIENGVARSPVTDLRTGRQVGTPSTGHSSGSAEYGPYASNIVLEAGSSSLDDMVAGVEDGFLVTRFHYVNILDRPSTLLTGMTRD
ncbi:MAG TPA: TldD/PmbA family protein, partial [Actinomycetota bacterium]|nr:TldD/PmbA family protein [Actinomycetota bacterium]